MNIDLSGKTALVTGSTAGIGYALFDISRVGATEPQNPGPVSTQAEKDGVPGLSPSRAHALCFVDICRA